MLNIFGLLIPIIYMECKDPSASPFAMSSVIDIDDSVLDIAKLAAAAPIPVELHTQLLSTNLSVARILDVLCLRNWPHSPLPPESSSTKYQDDSPNFTPDDVS
jgi:hypothetical protein